MSNGTWVPYLTIFFVTHARLKKVFKLDQESGAGLQNLISSVLAGLIASSVTYPLDVAKTRLQSGWNLKSEFSSTLKGSWSSIAVTHSRGLVLRIIWLAPNSALNVNFYEFFVCRI